ncbi:hypothetical protein EV356DRAFT_520446 [Viridothelium virens]|uniref:SAP domain-containing protein n=1 Tax=Viridothelium virens TaxID=1048519 RepID=A0A6A6GW50_VIRVR|nr:hypothetical protein EV356DRAFT_520446 [Viridothelium virens]
MAASRASSLRNLTKLTATQSRHLHMTGPSTFPSPMLTSERPAFNLPTDTAGLRAECQKRNLPVTGNKAELRDRLSADELIKSRSFSTALEATRRPSTTTTTTSSKPVRHFNTSRALKAVNDSSTVDFAYLPRFETEAADAQVQIPLAPDSTQVNPDAASFVEEAAVHRGEISTSAADIPHNVAHMAEVHDNSAAPIDYHTLADVVSGTASKLSSATKGGTLREVWDGFLDDLLGPKSGGPKAV